MLLSALSLLLALGRAAPLPPQTLPGGAQITASVKLVKITPSQPGVLTFGGEDGPLQYLVVYGAIPPDEVKKETNDELAEMVQGFAKQGGGVVQATLPTTLRGWYGIDARVKSGTFEGRMRGYVISKYAYLLVCVNSKPGVPNASAEAFLASLTPPAEIAKGPAPDDKAGWRSVQIAKSPVTIDFPGTPTISDKPNPGAPSEAALRITSAELATPAEYVQIFQIPFPPEEGEKIDADKEIDLADVVATQYLNAIQCTGWKRTQRIDHGRMVLTYRVGKGDRTLRSDIFRKDDAFYLINFMGRTNVAGTEDEARYFKSLSVAGDK